MLLGERRALMRDLCEGRIDKLTSDTYTNF
jgi:hypothetical protein